jgi:hypothetical protein
MTDLDLNALTLREEAPLSERNAQAEDAALESHLAALYERLRERQVAANPLECAHLQLQIARTLVELQRGASAWAIGRPTFGIFLAAEDFEAAADLCEVLFRAEQSASLAALGQGIWLAVTYPVDPDLSVDLLTHVVEETQDNSDGAAVAAMTALFLVDLRAVGPQREKLLFFTEQLLGQVAARHSGVASQEAMDQWLDRLELRDPSKFLPRLRKVVDILVQGDWWLDRERLQAALPVN